MGLFGIRRKRRTRRGPRSGKEGVGSLLDRSPFSEFFIWLDGQPAEIRRAVNRVGSEESGDLRKEIGAADPVNFEWDTKLLTSLPANLGDHNENEAAEAVARWGAECPWFGVVDRHLFLLSLRQSLGRRGAFPEAFVAAKTDLHLTPELIATDSMFEHNRTDALEDLLGWSSESRQKDAAAEALRWSVANDVVTAQEASRLASSYSVHFDD